MDSETSTDTPLRKDLKLAAVSSLPSARSSASARSGASASARSSVSASASASAVMSTDRRSSSRLSVPEAKETVKRGAKRDTKGATSSHASKVIS
jgi:hypothetical protein